MRQREEETPSHTGGVSEVAKARLEEYRRQREKNRGEVFPILTTSDSIFS
jgi:hypothetical protein